jgi:hypothetical protein
MFTLPAVDEYGIAYDAQVFYNVEHAEMFVSWLKDLEDEATISAAYFLRDAIACLENQLARV